MADESTSPGATHVGSTRGGEDEQIKDRLEHVQDALEDIEAQVQEDAQSLKRLREVLDVSYIQEITDMINDLELQVKDVAAEAERARERADEAEADLRAEQERLEKLWDVYKEQERELEEAEQAKAQAERELEKAETEVDHLEDELRSERRALRQAQQENGRLREELTEKEAKAEELAAHGDIEERVQDLEDELEEERERLAKLYGVFEETEAERDDLAAELRQWRAWYKAHAETLEGIKAAVNEAPEPAE